MMFRALTVLLSVTALSVVAAPSELLESRAAADNTVSISSATKFCMIMPRKAHTNIGDSESPGGTKTYCSASGKTSSSQGTLPSNFWTKVAFKSGKGKHGKSYAQLTGCITKDFSQLNPHDGGGQYDSSGGAGGKGNPKGSVCTGYNHYVEIVEPSGPRACIKCCDDPADCPTNKDEDGCPEVISGNYFNCG